MRNYSFTSKSVLLNIDKTYCDSEPQVLSSKLFNTLLVKYLRYKPNHQNPVYNLKSTEILSFYKFLLVNTYKDLIIHFKQYEFLNNYEHLYFFSEGFYEYWRHFERFSYQIVHKDHTQTTRSNKLIKDTQDLETLILKLYRTLSQKMMSRSFGVYRQLPSGVQTGLLLDKHFSLMKVYPTLPTKQFVHNLLLNTPIMIYSESNTRSGVYEYVNTPFIDDLKISNSNFFVYPIKVGDLTAFVYTHKDMLRHMVSLGNLFEILDLSRHPNLKPDLIILFGILEKEYDGKYYLDKTTNIYIGAVHNSNKNDYFGYLKKMILTLHNTYNLDNKSLPIHGAMVKITFNNNISKNIVIVGDSGAGKSETIEAIRTVGKNYIKYIDVVFDDMGSFTLNGNKLFAKGTETGAFVRLDDLETGYTYRRLERSIFLNPNQTNARVVLPISTYEFITKEHSVDMVLYANNFEEPKSLLRKIDTIKEALSVFKTGARVAKGTTNEKGLVKTYFANPFGPLQQMEKTDKLLDLYFSYLFDNNIYVGEIYTKLSIDNYSEKGPLEAAKALLDYITKQF